MTEPPDLRDLRARMSDMSQDVTSLREELNKSLKDEGNQATSHSELQNRMSELTRKVPHESYGFPC